MIKAILTLLRPHQYLKNTFIFLPLFFGLKIHHLDLLLACAYAFVAFSCVASAVYIFNDYQDREDDRQHPRKKFRPLASGMVSSRQAGILFLSLLLAGLGIAFWLDLRFFFLLTFYLVLNLAYSVRLKHIALVDVSIIASGFVLRLLAGHFASGVDLSLWIVIMTFLLALFLALAKRRDDVIIFLESGTRARKVIDGYNLPLLDAAMVMMATTTVVCYIMYTVSPEVVHRVGSDRLYLTTIFVIMSILRYMQITFVEKRSGSPTEILIHDRLFQALLLAWLATFGVIIYPVLRLAF